MKQRSWKRSLSLLLTLALVLTMPCAASVWAEETVNYVYGVWEGNQVVWKSGTETKCIAVTSNDSTWSGDWYVAEGEITIDHRVTVSGDVHLILKDGCDLTIEGGIRVEGNNSLTIYAQSKDGTGSLTANGGSSLNAGIGGDGANAQNDNDTINAKGGDCGTVTIHGGTVTAIGGSTTISGSTVGGAGIGGGGAHGKDNVSDGSNKKTGGSGGVITIYGGTVKTTSIGGGFGLGGGGTGSNGGSVSISGGTVDVTGGTNAAAIGGGSGNSAGSDGIFSTGADGTAVIYAAAGSSASEINAISDQSNIDNWSCILFEKTEDESVEAYTGTVYGTMTLQENLTLPKPGEDGQTVSTTLSIPSGSTLTVAQGGELNVNAGSELKVNDGGQLKVDKGGKLANKGTLTIDGGGTVENNGAIASSGTVNGTIDNSGGGTFINGDFSSPSSGSTPSLGYLPDAPREPEYATFLSDTYGDLTVSGRYQFRITSLNGSKPVMSVSNESFAVSLASQNGNEYFYVLTCTGEPGSMAIVYMNGVFFLTATVGDTFSGVVSDTNAPFTVAQGGSYQFRLTAAEKPTMAAGSPSFTVAYVGNEGRDWFFKVTAVGETGDGCGFYVNGQKDPVAIAHIA